MDRYIVIDMNILPSRIADIEPMTLPSLFIQHTEHVF